MGANGAGSSLGQGEQPRNPLSKTSADWAQVVIGLATVAALVVAIIVARQGQATVDHNSQVTLRQSEDTQLSTAITAIGATDQAEQIAGLFLLTQNTVSRLTNGNGSGEPAANVYMDYTTALKILSGYLSSHSEMFLAGAKTPPFGLGYGPPPTMPPIAIVYAADQLTSLLATDIQHKVTALQSGMRPAIDLSHDELYGQPWFGINFGWINAFMTGIDLRGAELGSSQWSAYSILDHSYLQCADLRGANFSGADLSFANLNGANVQGADFRGADLAGATITTVYGHAQWSRQPPGITIRAEDSWHVGTCLQNPGFWSGQPSAVSSPAPSSSAAPSSSPSPKPSVSTGK
jgi:hypothetical protein